MNSSKIFYTSDLHFGHKNVIKFSNRPYKDSIDMETKLIENWNKKVALEDTVYILGDMFYGKSDYCKVLDSLKGKKILVKGNHEQWIERYRELEEYFEEITDYKIITDNERKVVLFHFPILDWNHKYHNSYHVYGHVHNIQNIDTLVMYNQINALNAGVDVNSYEPCTLEELIKNKEKYKYNIYI